MNRIAPHHRRTGVVILGLVAAACTAGTDDHEVQGVLSRGDPIPATIRVENGVSIYDYPVDAFDKAPQWTLEAKPSATIGGAEGDPQYDLTRVNNVVPLSDGRVITFAGIGNKVFVFDRDGKGERVIGQTGQGPGDWMRFGTPVLLREDTVLVLDFANRRLNWVTADGGIVRTAPYEITGEMRRMHGIAGFISTGELLMHSAGVWGSHETDSLHRSLATVVAANISSGEARVIAKIPDQQGVEVETRYRGRVLKDWQPLRLSGWSLLAAWDSVYASAVPPSRVIDLRDATGMLRAQLRVPTIRRAVTKETRDARIAQELGWLHAPGSEGLIDRNESERLAREAPFADSLAYFSHMMTGSDGTLWVVDAIAPNDSGWTATAFSKDGSILGRLTVKRKSIPMAFGANQVIVRMTDQNDVVSLGVYRLVVQNTSKD